MRSSIVAGGKRCKFQSAPDTEQGREEPVRCINETDKRTVKHPLSTLECRE